VSEFKTGDLGVPAMPTWLSEVETLCVAVGSSAVSFFFLVSTSLNEEEKRMPLPPLTRELRSNLFLLEIASFLAMTKNPCFPYFLKQ